MAAFKLLIFEDDKDWVDGFIYNIKSRLEARNISFLHIHRLDNSTIMQDLEWLPDLILIDHDLGSQLGTDIIDQIDGDPQYKSASIYYYSGGETLESLREKAKDFECSVHCYTKDGEDLETAVISKAVAIIGKLGKKQTNQE